MNEYSVDKVVVVKSGGLDKWNKEKLPIETEINARVDYDFSVKGGDSLIRDITGEEVVPYARVTIRGYYDIGTKDKIKLNGKKHNILKVAPKKGFVIEFTVVYIK